MLMWTLLAPTAPCAAYAQDAGEVPHRTPRSRSLAILGTLAGGLIGLGFSVASGKGTHGQCAGVNCAVVVGAVGGGLAGFFVGREYDKNYAMYYRGAAPLRPTSIDADLDGVPDVLAVSDSVIAVGGSAGVQVFRNDDALTTSTRRARGIRGLDVLAIAPGAGNLVVGSPAGLYLFPPREGRGTLIRAGEVGAATASSDHVYFGVNDRLEIAPLTTDSAHRWPGITLGAPVLDVALDSARHLLWGITDRELIAFRIVADSLSRVGDAPIEGGAHRLAILGNRAAVAIGEAGVLLFDIGTPDAPRSIAHWTTARFAYDVSLDGTRLFVAAGPEGVYVVDVSGSTPRTIGLARSLGFATALVSRGGRTYIVDRRENALRRIPSDF